MKNKLRKIGLSILTLVVSCLAAAIGFGFMSDSPVAFWIRFLCGLCFILTPLLIIQLIILLFKKEPKGKEKPEAQMDSDLDSISDSYPDQDPHPDQNSYSGSESKSDTESDSGSTPK